MRNHLLLLALVALGCSSEAPSEPSQSPPLLAPPKAGQGIQYAMKTQIAAGEEAEHCQFVLAPPEGLNVNSDEVRFTQGSHHVLLYVTPYSEIPTVDELGNAVDTSKVFDCSEGVQFRWRVSNLVAGSQNSTGESVIDFPKDVAMKVKPNAVLLINAHYVNASPEDLEPEVFINVNTIPDEQVKQEGGLLFWYNAFIRVGAHSSASARMSCPVPYDITLSNAQSHMHRRGMGYEAELLSDEGPSLIYENDRWENVPVKLFDGGLSVSGGSRIEYHCDYQNDSDDTVWQGPRSSDEMCMFISSYWPATPAVSNCAADEQNVQRTQNLAAHWVGAGDKTCAETLGCVQKIDQDQSFEPFIKDLTDCVLASRPESSETVSNGIRCLLTKDDPLSACQKEIQACLAD